MISVIATTVRMPKKLSDILKKSAREQGHTLNSLILQILWGWVKSNL